MTLQLIVGAGAVALTPLLLWWSLAAGRSRATSVARDRVGGLLSVTDMRQAVLAHSATDRAVLPLMKVLADRARRFTPAGVVHALERRVLLAGAPERWTMERVLAGKALGFVGGLVVGVYRYVSAPSSFMFLQGIASTGLGYFGPDLALSNRAEKRQKQIQLELPDTLDQITISVEAGLGFEAAMARAGKSGKGPLAEELVRTLQDVQAGLSRQEALKSLVNRTNVPELRHFVLALLQAESFGVPIAHVLRVQSRELRVKRRQRAEEHAMKIPVKVLFPLILCILPCMFIVIMGPAGIRISNDLLK